jgi:predicted glycosyltransferase
VTQPRVLLYSHDTFGLGHTQRTISIGEAILEREPEAKILYVTGSPMIQNLSPPQGMDYVKLPSATKLGPENYAARYLSLPFDDLLRLRMRLIRTVAEEFQPDIFLVDHAPIGMSGEILPTLRFFQANGTKVVLGLRDVLDDPTKVLPVWEKQHVIEAMREFYDLILVYGMSEFYNPVREYGIPPDVGEKTKFTGYVYRPRAVQSLSEVRANLQVPEGKLVLVMVGGGEDGQFVLRMVANALRLRPLRDFSVCIVTGPMCPDNVRETLKKEANERVFVTEFVQDMPSVIAAADLVVSMGGYNSVCELLAYGRRSIVLPRTTPRREQLIRATFLAKQCFVTLVNPTESNDMQLRESIEKALADESEPLSERRTKVKLDGARKAAELLLNTTNEANFTKGLGRLRKRVTQPLGASHPNQDAAA